MNEHTNEGMNTTKSALINKHIKRKQNRENENPEGK